MSKAKRVEGRPNIAALSFVGERDKREAGKCPRSFWRVTSSGDYGADCDLGHRLALEYLAFQEANNDQSNLQHIVADMPRELTGVEVGFLTMVSFAAGAGADRARQIAAYWEAAEARRQTGA